MTNKARFYATLAQVPLGSRFEKTEVPTEIWQSLGRGEVEGQIKTPQKAIFYETSLPGIWRIETEHEAYLQVGYYPGLLETAGKAGESGVLRWPKDLMNAQGLLIEALAHAKHCRPFQVNLDQLPLNSADENFLESVSQGNARIVLKGYGDTVAHKTVFSHIWRLRFFNVHGKLILDALEVATIPAIFMATPEDWQNSQKTLLHRASLCL